jgi:hypothetical protein
MLAWRVVLSSRRRGPWHCRVPVLFACHWHPVLALLLLRLIQIPTRLVKPPPMRSIGRRIPIGLLLRRSVFLGMPKKEHGRVHLMCLSLPGAVLAMPDRGRRNPSFPSAKIGAVTFVSAPITLLGAAPADAGATRDRAT